jgi:molecular chaperone IbpA
MTTDEYNIQQEKTYWKHYNQGSRIIGFDELFKTLSELEKPTTGFPAYNIIKLSDTKFKIVLAVAGFSKNDIRVTLHNGSLSVEGSIDQNKPVLNFIYKGIAERNFKRDFTVADTVEVSKVFLEDGLLTVILDNIIPESTKIKTFEIE